MKKTNILAKYNLIFLVFSTLFLIFPIQIKAQTLTSPQVPFLQRTSTATPAQTIYNVKGDFTLLGNINLTLVNYTTGTDNESNIMKYVDVDGDSNTLNSSMATLELSNSGENGAIQNCSTILFAGLYWTGKSDDANETFSISNITATHNFTIPYTNYVMTVTRGGSNNNYYPIYTFTGNGHSYAFNFTNAATSGTSTVTLTLDGVAQPAIDVAYSSGTATFTIPFTSDVAYGTAFTINSFTRDTNKGRTEPQYQSTSYANVTYSPSKNYDKMEVSLKGPGETTYTTITTSSAIRFPGATNSGIFIGYQEITDYVIAHGPGAYTIADIALKEGTNSNPGLSGGWGMVVIYENPVMKSRAVTLFDGYAFVDGQLGAGEYGNIDISGFTTVGSGQVNMKLGVMAAEGDVNLSGDYLAVQKLNADPAVYPGNYLVLNHAGNSTNNFFNSSIFPFPTVGNSNPNLVNNTGVDFSMFTIPNTDNLVIGNNQTATTFRFGSSSDVFTIFGFAMSVDAYIPEPEGLVTVNSINGDAVSYPLTVNALPGQSINYTLSITNEGTEATNSTLITIPIPNTAIFSTGSITYNLYYGATQVSGPTYNPGPNTITWNLGTLPITAGHPEYIYSDLSFTLDVTSDCSIILNAGCDPLVTLETGAITGTGAISGTSFTKYFFQGYDGTSCNLPITGSVQVAIDGSSCVAAMAGLDQASACGGENVSLAATDVTDGAWSFVSGPAGGDFEDSASPTSGFSSVNPGVYTLRWTSASCGANFDDVLVTISLCDVVNFDGIDDNINFKNDFNLDSGNFSIEAWVKPNATNGNTQSILSKHLSPASVDGYDLRLVNNVISFNWNNNSIVAPHAIDTYRWYHIAVTFDGTNYNLYIDGIFENTAPGVNPTLNSVDFILGAMSQNTDIPYNYYNGFTDELRIWNVSLTVEQIRQMMNQEITNDGSGNVKGVIVPMKISGLSWANLAGYYQMNRASDISDGYLVDKSGNAKNGKLKCIYEPEPDTAPLPYTSGADGSWETDATWTNYPVWDSPNSLGLDGTPIDWNIVQTSHNITSGDKNIIVLGLISESGILTIAEPSETLNENNSGQSLRVTHYLELDGFIDLVGESQLLQDEGSILDQDSGGYIERDQQGTANSFNYNYWSSAVGPITPSGTGQRGTGLASTNANYTISNVLMDGTDPSIPNKNGTISFGTTYAYADAGITSPIKISTYWLYTFNGTHDDYNSWNPIDQNTGLLAGEGYTMKGTSGAVAITTKQNYVFKGKPYNGGFTLQIDAGDDRLIGNPYPSAMDVEEFIKDNLSISEGFRNVAGNIFIGALYFWDHFGEINTHILREYVGGYATRNLIGGTKAISNDYRINANLDEGVKIPGQYIPVNQGFFVTAVGPVLPPPTIDGGQIVFKNSQRVFETEAMGSSVFMKGMKSKPTSSAGAKKTHESNTNTEERPKIWLLFSSPTGYHRQLLVGVHESTSNNFDIGYDAPIADVGIEDMFWIIDGGKFVIQGVSNFDADQELPLGLIINKAGLAKIKIDSLENVAKKVSLYIKDNLVGETYDITKNSFEINLEPGTYSNRFYLVFQPRLKSLEEISLSDGIQVYMDQINCEIQVKKIVDTKIKSIKLINSLGQIINSWNSNLEEINFSLPINVSAGMYLVQINTKNGSVVKKVIVFDGY